MKLSEIAAKVLGLEARAQSADASLRADVTAFRTLIDGEMQSLTASLAQANSDLVAAKKANTELQDTFNVSASQIKSITAALDSSAANLKLDIKADASPADKISALENSVASTLAKLNVKPGTIPAGQPSTAAVTAPGKQITMTAFRALNDLEKMNYIKSGGRIVEG